MEISRFTHPTQVGTEVLFPKPISVQIGALDLSVLFMTAPFEWGPLNEPVEIYNEAELRDMFYNGGESFKQALILFKHFKPSKIVLNRICHYTDAADSSTFIAVKSSIMLENVTPNDILNVEGRYPGVLGDQFEAKITHSSKVNTITVNPLVDQDTSSELVNANGINVGDILNWDDGTNPAVLAIVTDVIGNTVYFDAVTVGVTILAGADVTSIHFDMEILFKGNQVKLYEFLSMQPENVSEFVGNIISRNQNIYFNVEPQDMSAIGYDIRRPIEGTFALTGGDDGLTGIADTDYIGDEAARTGIYALDVYGDGKLPVIITCPERISAAIQQKYIEYAKEKGIHYFIGDIALEQTDDDAITFLDDFVKANNEWCQYNYGNLIYEDPENPGVEIILKNSPSVVGRMAMTDKLGGKGPWQASAGEIYGILPGVRGIEPVLKNGEYIVPTQDVVVRDKLRRKKINPIYKKGYNFVREGNVNRIIGRNITYKYDNELRTIMYIGSSVDWHLYWVPFQNHTSALERQVKALVLKFIDGLPLEALFGATPDEKRSVICGKDNNPRDPNSGRIITPEDLNIHIGASTQTPTLRGHWYVTKKLT